MMFKPPHNAYFAARAACAARLAANAIILLAVLFPDAALAQAYPVKPVRLVVGFPPGGSTDLVARAIAPRLSAALGQQVIVDNRPGANSVIATDHVAKAAPDGYTITLGTLGGLVLSPSIQKVPYDSIKDFAPIARVVELQNILIVHPSLPARALKEFIALAKSQPGKLNYATSGVGGPGHLAGELLKSMARIDIVHVPYKGGGPAITDLLAGHVETFMAVISTAVPHVQGGKARALAVTGAKRASALPDVPTVAQAALPGYEATNWYGIFAPANTPQPIIDRLHREIITIINMPDVREFLDSRGIDTAPGSPAELTAYLKSETAKWAKVVKAAGLKAD